MTKFGFGLSVSHSNFGNIRNFRPHLRPWVVASGAAASVATSVYLAHKDRSASVVKPAEDQRLKLPPTLVEAIAGAVGEVAQIVILYPLDTIKVRCQAAGKSARKVVQELCKDGFNLEVVKKLYAGAIAAAATSIAVGAIHFASYSTSKRAFLDFFHTGDEPVAGNSEAEKAAKRPRQMGHGHSAGGAQGSTASPEYQSLRMWANIFAAVVAALCTAVVEAPIELFRHNAQAGLVKGSFIKEMFRVLKKNGPRSLYWGFLPYCFEAWPYDITELLVYGHLKDGHESCQGKPVSMPLVGSSIPQHVVDLGMGAAAGAAAVMVSMPFDCIKTYMQTHGTEVAGKSMQNGALAFFMTGQQMVQRGGLKALYVGLAPRLCQQVPGAMVCWWAIENCSRSLQPYT